VTGSVKYAHNEVGSFSVNESDFAELKGKKAEQVEIEFLPTPVEDAADSLVLARWIIRNVAHLNNSLATFVPKLEIGNAGNGMHIHMALKKGGRNITVDETGKLSKSAMMLIGGLCKYAPTLMAYGNMVSASYLRLVPNQEAPTKVSWSEMNRHAMIRVPLGWGNVNNLAKLVNPQQKGELKDMDSRQTVELRSPDGSAHIHLLLAGITTAADWALGNAKESIAIAEKSHVSGDKHENNPVDEKSDIPSTCVESSEILVRDRSLYENNSFFPLVVIDYVYKQLQMENDRNLNETLYALPDDEKLRESRRIMHRDIHRH
jgi:glutamine synthetase